MDALAELQAQFAAVQSEDSVYKLSDRNVVDLIMKLQAQNLITFIYTLNGKEFLTPEFVDKAVLQSIARNGGRATLMEVQQALNVDSVYIEQSLQRTLEKQQPNTEDTIYCLANGTDILTQWYIDGIMEDVNIALQATGQTSIAEIAQSNGLPIDFTTSAVTSRLSTTFSAAERRNGMLYTDVYMAAERGRVRGIFCAITQPTLLPDVSVSRSLSLSNDDLAKVVSSLISTGVLSGTLRGNREYMPYRFIATQQDSLFSFFSQNRYLEHSRATQLQVTRPYDFLKKRFPNAVPLPSVVVAESVVTSLEARIESVVYQDEFLLDLTNNVGDDDNILPSAITGKDLSALVSLVLKKSIENSAVQLTENDGSDGVFIMSNGLISKILEKFKAHATDSALIAARDARKNKESIIMSSTVSAVGNAEVGDNYDSDDGRRGSRKKGGRRKSSNRTTTEDLSDSDEKKKGKKKKKRGGSKKKDSTVNNSDKSTSSIAPSQEDALDLLCDTWLDEAFGGDEYPHVLSAFLNAYYDSRIKALYDTALVEAMKTVHKGDDAKARQLQAVFYERYEVLEAKLLLLSKGIDKLRDLDNEDLVASSAIEAHVLDTTGTELASLITSMACEVNGVELFNDGRESLGPVIMVDGDDDTVTTLTCLSSEHKEYLEKNLPSTIAPAVVRSWVLSTAGRRSVADLMGHLSGAVTAVFNIPLKKMDRKRERQILFQDRHLKSESLDKSAKTVLKCLRYTLELLFQQLYSVSITLPEDWETLEGFYSQVIASKIPEAVHLKMMEILSQKEGEVAFLKRLGLARDVQKFEVA